MGGTDLKEYLKLSLLPMHTNMYGTIFGGVIMSYLDQAGAHCARDAFDNRFVTVQADGIRFLQPVNVGDLVTFRGRVVDRGTTSVTVDIVVDAERLDTREIVRVTEARLVYVAVGPDGAKTALRPRADGVR
ncbi:MAG: acyl-CoA thioesterase [Candidatus Krumholzibacteriia bacterium]